MIRKGLEFQTTSGKLGVRKDSSQYIVSTGPDVCKTPMGSSMVPVAYSSIAFQDKSVRTHSRVRLNGRLDFHINSRIKASQGTEPGTGKGIKDAGHLGPAEVIKSTNSLHSEGHPSVRHRDGAVINKSSLD